jgi:hypothetical protein
MEKSRPESSLRGVPPLIVNRDHHPAGEYVYTPSRLWLSVSLRPCSLEMRFDGRAWEGTSQRGDVNVMARGGRRAQSRTLFDAVPQCDQ